VQQGADEIGRNSLPISTLWSREEALTGSTTIIPNRTRAKKNKQLDEISSVFYLSFSERKTKKKEDGYSGIDAQS